MRRIVATGATTPARKEGPSPAGRPVTGSFPNRVPRHRYSLWQSRHTTRSRSNGSLWWPRGSSMAGASHQLQAPGSSGMGSGLASRMFR